MSNKPNNLTSKLKLNDTTWNTDIKGGSYGDVLQTYYIIATTKGSAVAHLNNLCWGSCEIFITDIKEVSDLGFQITNVAYKKIEDTVLENMV